MNRPSHDESAVCSRTVLLTRPEHQVEPLRSLFRGVGAVVLSQPTIEIRAPRSWDHVDAALRRLDSFDWLVFASRNGVNFFCERFVDLFGKKYDKASKICAIGPATASALRQRMIFVDEIPTPHNAEGIVAVLTEEARQGKRILLIRADRGRNVMLRELSAVHPDSHGVEEIAVYESVDLERPLPDIFQRMKHGEIDWTTCTSSAIAVSLVRMFGETLHRTKIASISPITTQTLLKLGFAPAVESETATMPALFDAVYQSW